MTREHDAPPPLPAGATWRRFGRYSAHAGQWSVSLPGYVAAARVERTGASGPAAWSAHCRGITAGGFRTRDLAARHAFAAAGFLPLPTGQAERVAANRRRAAASPPCPDCGQGWPDGCAFDCPSRDE